MKTLILLLSFLMSYPLFAANNDQLFDVISPGSKDSFDQKVLLAKQTAYNWINSYYSANRKTIDSNVRNKLEVTNMLAGFGSVTLMKYNIDKGRSVTSNCTGQNPVVAYIPAPFRNILKICHSSFSFDVKQLAQTLVHEMYHYAEQTVDLLYQSGNAPLKFNNSEIQREVNAVAYEETILYQADKGCLYRYIPYFDIEPYKSALSRAQLEQLPYCDNYEAMQIDQTKYLSSTY